MLRCQSFRHPCFTICNPAGWYVPDSYASSTARWQDISGANNHANVTGTLTYMPKLINGNERRRSSKPVSGGAPLTARQPVS
jgi:hypothetical protein